MTCYHPIPAYQCLDGGIVFVNNLRRNDVVRRIDVPCGNCIGCRLRRARDWSVRIMHEAQMWERNCFITLTYADEFEPEGRSLRYRDFQLFMKRLRWEVYPDRPRFFMSGEYGPLNLRPHYHACVFNVDFSDRVRAGKSEAGELFYSSARLTELWSLGRCSVQDLTVQSAAYTARYCVDKVTGDAAEAHYGGRVPEFCRCSLRPGIGADWFSKYGADVYRHDFVVQDGAELAPPRYYDRLNKRRDKSTRIDELEYARVLRAKSVQPDNTDERLAVRELVHRARVLNQKRVL